MFLKLLITALSLGTAWAVRGQFGHEQGAAWAGGVACLVILVMARRPDWNANLFGITLAGAIGWGLGGMMSYGLLVGNGHKPALPLAVYSNAMLAVVGGLYGFLGGGLFGLALSRSEKSTVRWILLSLLMLVGGILCYLLVITLLNWRMTPPRSEAWAVCLGIALVLAGYLIRTKNRAALRVACYTAIGAGFGFAFGNILHRFGIQSGIPFNFWNVMEYSLGFFGGIGLAFGTFSAKWHGPEATEIKANYPRQFTAFLFLALLIPLKVWLSSFGITKMEKALSIAGLDHYAVSFHYIALISLILFVLLSGHILFFKTRKNSPAFSRHEADTFFTAWFLFYIFLSLLVTGAFFSTHRIEQYLYPVNFLVILLLLRTAGRQCSDTPA